MKEGANQEHIFTRAKESSEDMEQIVLPENIESELLSEEPNAPLGRFLAELTSAGATEAELERFKASVYAFKDRPAEVKKTEDSNSVRFVPQESYFGTHIEFPMEFYSMPDLLAGSSLKPKIANADNQTSKNEFQKVDGADVLKKMEEAPPSGEGISPMEKLLVQLNRMTYRFHESLHVIQNLSEGDKINRLKEQVGAEGLFDKIKEAKALQRNYRISRQTLPKPAWVDNSFFVSDQSHELSKDDPSYWAMFVLFQNEATMDIMQEEALRDYIRSKPVLMLWLHNTVVSMMEGFREYHGQALKAARGEQTELNDPVAYERLSQTINFIAQPYFSAFHDSQEAEQFIQSQPLQLGGKQVSANIAQSQPFSSLDITNLVNETKALLDKTNNGTQTLTPDVLEEYKYPSGVTYLRNLGENPAITPRGAELASDLLLGCAQRNRKDDDIRVELYKLDEIIDANNVDGLDKMRATLEDKTGIKLSDDDLKELYGASNYISLNLGDPYPYSYAVRKELLAKMKTAMPEQVKMLKRSVLFEMPTSLSMATFSALVGFYKDRNFKNEQMEFWENEDDKYTVNARRSWKDLSEDTHLGVTNIDVTRLNPEDLAKLEDFYLRSEKEGHLDEFQKQVLKFFVQVARKQQ